MSRLTKFLCFAMVLFVSIAFMNSTSYAKGESKNMKPKATEKTVVLHQKGFSAKISVSDVKMMHDFIKKYNLDSGEEMPPIENNDDEDDDDFDPGCVCGEVPAAPDFDGNPIGTECRCAPSECGSC